jgi:hypothetical protein
MYYYQNCCFGFPFYAFCPVFFFPISISVTLHMDNPEYDTGKSTGRICQRFGDRNTDQEPRKTRPLIPLTHDRQTVCFIPVQVNFWWSELKLGVKASL